jgi:hypothetical protein
MCKYCKLTFGDHFESNKNLLEGEVNMNGLKFLDMEVYITHDENGKAKLQLWVDNGDLCDCVVSKKITIKYCPVCGQKLF